MFNIYIDSDSIPFFHRSIILKRVLKESSFIGECVFSSDRVLKDIKTSIDNDTSKLRRESELDKNDEKRKEIKSKIRLVVVPTGENSADDYLFSVSKLPGFIISHDIPLLGRFVQNGFDSLDDRGNIYTKENIKERLSLRDAMSEYREYGIYNEKTKRFTEKDKLEFAKSFDFLFNKYKKST